MTLEEAEKMLAAGKVKAAAMGLAVSIAVVDQRGDLVALAKGDGTRYYTPDIARGKALVAASTGRASGAAAEMATSPVMQAVNEMNQGRMIFWQGAVPVTRDGEMIGAVGVSGAAAPQDEEIATAAAAAL